MEAQFNQLLNKWVQEHYGLREELVPYVREAFYIASKQKEAITQDSDIASTQKEAITQESDIASTQKQVITQDSDITSTQKQAITQDSDQVKVRVWKAFLQAEEECLKAYQLQLEANKAWKLASEKRDRAKEEYEDVWSVGK